MLPGAPRRRRARPVADAPIDALLSRSEDLAKGWLLALLEGAPLDDAPRILAAELTRDGPRVCDAMLRAIADDADQRRLEPGGALAPLAARVGELAGATGPEATSYAVDALQGVVWAALRSELRDPDPELIAELAERLAQVSELMRAAALRVAVAGAEGGARGPALAAVPPAPQVERPPAPAQEPPPAARAESPASEAPHAPPSEPPPPVATTRAPIPPPQPPPARPPEVEPEVAPRPSTPQTWGPPETSSLPQMSGLPQTSSLPQTWGGTQRPSPTPDALWVGALQEEIQRTSDAPLSLLLAELEDADRVLAVDPETRGATTFSAFAQAVRGVVRRQDILVSETESRAWIIARDTSRPGAQALGARISAAVREAPPWRGAPMAASVGIAVLGEDGRTPQELMDSAEESRFAAAANGVDVIRPGPDEPSPE